MLADEWALNRDSIPENFKVFFKDSPVIDEDKIYRFRKVYKLTWHESGNMEDIFLIEKEIHGAIPHRGGRANVKWLEQLLKGVINV